MNKLKPSKNKNIKKYEDLITHVKDRPGHDKRYAINFTKIQKNLNWYPKNTFKTGLKKTINWYLKNRKWCEKVKATNYKGERLGKL